MRLDRNRQLRSGAFLWRIFPALVILGALIPGRQARAQVLNDYRNRISGDWSDPGTWERFDGAGWVNASSFPKNNNAETITIRSEYAVTVDAAVGKNIKLDQLIVEFEATLVIEEKTLIQDGPGTDLVSYGTIQLASDHLEFRNASTALLKSTSILNIDDKDFKFKNTSSGTFENGAQVNIAALGELKAEGTSSVTMEQGTQIDSNGKINIKTDAIVSMAGSITNNGVFVVDDDAVLTAESTALITNNNVIRLKMQAQADIVGTLINTKNVVLLDSGTLDFLSGSTYETFAEAISAASASDRIVADADAFTGETQTFAFNCKCVQFSVNNTEGPGSADTTQAIVLAGCGSFNANSTNLAMVSSGVTGTSRINASNGINMESVGFETGGTTHGEDRVSLRPGEHRHPRAQTVRAHTSRRRLPARHPLHLVLDTADALLLHRIQLQDDLVQRSERPSGHDAAD